MPKVDGKHYSYDKKGYRAAALARMKNKSKKYAGKAKKKMIDTGTRVPKNPYYDLGG